MPLVFGVIGAVSPWRSWIGRSPLSNTIDTSFCGAALKEVPARSGKPEIFTIDQGSQVTGFDFTSIVAAAGIKISMDGRGRRAARHHQDNPCLDAAVPLMIVRLASIAEATPIILTSEERTELERLARPTKTESRARAQERHMARPS